MLSNMPHLSPISSKAILRSVSQQGPKVAGSTGPCRYLSTTAPAQKNVTLLQDKKNGFGFARSNPRPPKPRSKGVTEIRGPYYTVMGKRYLADVLETMGTHVDGLKFAGGSFSLFQEKPLRELIDLAHEHGVYVSTGGWAEHLLTHPDTNAVFDKYLQKCKDLGFDVIELSSGFLSFPEDDWLRLVDKVHSYKLKAKPELGIQFGAGRQRYPLVGPRVRKRGRPPTPAALIPAEAVKRLGGAVWGDRSPVAVWSPAPLGSVDRWPLAIIEKQIPGGSRPAVAAVRRRVRRVWSPHPRAVCRRPVSALWGGHDGNNLACGPDPEGFQWGQLDGRMCAAGAPVVSL